MKIIICFGTRPEAIKLAPVIWKMATSETFDPFICVTGQQRELLKDSLQHLDIIPDIDLNIMKKNQSLEEVHIKVFEGISKLLKQSKFDLMIVQGDTSSAMASSMAGFIANVPIAHIEAGLRTFDIRSPFPEEGNRKIITQLATIHFAPTALARENLINEGVNTKSIYVTGNTGIDTLVKVTKSGYNGIPKSLRNIDFNKKIVAVTVHRRESFGNPIVQISKAIAQSSIDNLVNVEFVVITHLNPKAKIPLLTTLSNLPNVHLLNPISYPDMVYLLSKSELILTDSGGLQEESSYLGIKLIILREKTERIEGLKEKGARLTQLNIKRIVSGINEMLEMKHEPQKKSTIYGDGKAANRILKNIEEHFAIKSS